MSLVVVVDASHEGRNESHPGVGAGNGLGQREEQGEIAVNAFFFANLGSASAFPGGSDLDQDTVAGDSRLLVQTDQVAGFFHRRLDIEGKTGVDFRGNPAGHDIEDLRTESDQEIIDDLLGERLAAERGPLVIRDRLLEEGLVLRLLHRLEDQGRIRRSVLGRVLLDRFEVPGIGDNRGKLLKFVELGGGAHCN